MGASPITTVRITGARELRRALKKAGGDLGELTTLHREVGRVVLARGESTAPRRTGDLAASLRSSPTRTKARVTSRLPYAAPIHWGVPARGINPRPWLSDAAVQTESTWADLYRRKVEELITEVENSTP